MRLFAAKISCYCLSQGLTHRTLPFIADTFYKFTFLRLTSLRFEFLKQLFLENSDKVKVLNLV